MDNPELGPDIERMTAYCTYCPKLCRFTCPAAAGEGRETVTPWGMMRLLEVTRDGSIPLDADTAEVFFHCTGCRRCQTFCRHENDVPRALHKARTWAAAEDLLPDAVAALRDTFAAHGRPFAEAPDRPIDDAPFDPESPFAFWPDCSTVQHHPEKVEATAHLLKAFLGQAPRLIATDQAVPCCGFPLHAAGLDSPRELPDLDGLRAIYTDCPSFAAWHAPESSWDAPEGPHPPVRHLLTLLLDAEDLPEPTRRLDLGHAVLHPDCKTARQSRHLDLLDQVLAHLCEEPPQAAPFPREESPCCGGEHLYATVEPRGSRNAGIALLDATDTPSSTPIVTTSQTCRSHLQSLDEDRVVLTLLDLLLEAYSP